MLFIKGFLIPEQWVGRYNLQLLCRSLSGGFRKSVGWHGGAHHQMHRRVTIIVRRRKENRGEKAEGVEYVRILWSVRTELSISKKLKNEKKMVYSWKWDWIDRGNKKCFMIDSLTTRFLHPYYFIGCTSFQIWKRDSGTPYLSLVRSPMKWWPNMECDVVLILEPRVGFGRIRKLTCCLELDPSNSLLVDKRKSWKRMRMLCQNT